MNERLFVTKPLGSGRRRCRRIHLSTYSSPTPFKQRQKLFLKKKKPEPLQREEEVKGKGAFQYLQRQADEEIS